MKRFETLIRDDMVQSYLIMSISLIGLVASFAGLRFYGIDPAWLAILLCGLPITWEALVGLLTRFDIKAGLLVTMALAACIYLDELFAAGEVAFIMMLGEVLEQRTVNKARAGIERLVRLCPVTARVLKNGTETVIAAGEVRVGDLVRVHPGETVPVDGTIIEGCGAVDQSFVTGESIPADKGVGDELYGGTINMFGVLTLTAVRTGDDSTIGRMIRLVQSADTSKARVVRLMDRWASWIVIAALLAAAGTWFVSGELIRAASVLVVFCPCGLVLATPTAIVAGIGNLTRYGILVRAGDALERLASVRCVAFDKTGTLTHGRPEVVTVFSASGHFDERALLTLVAGAETCSEHPLGQAIVRYARGRKVSLPSIRDFTMQPGMGVRAGIGDRTVVAGRASLLAGRNIDISSDLHAIAATHQSRGETIVYIGVDGACAGFIALADSVRPEGAEVVRRLRDMGITPLLITGDGEQPARTVACNVGIRDVHARCLPEGKLRLVDRYSRTGQPVAMIGDGINDAPALKRASVGIAMGGVGSDIAVEASDIVLVGDDIRYVPHMFALARHMMTTIRVNISLSLALNFIGITLAMAGLLNPFWGAIVHNAGSVLVVGLSALLMRWRRYPEEPPVREMRPSRFTCPVIGEAAESGL